MESMVYWIGNFFNFSIIAFRTSSNCQIMSRQRRKSETSSILKEFQEQDLNSSDLRKDWKDFSLLVFLYLLQGVPLGLSFGSIPFLLKAKLSFSELALFSLSGYPYSLKLLWSPIVDSIFFTSFGRRKSWIVPIQAIIGITLISLGSTVDSFLDMEIIPITTLSIVFTILVTLCATQDIAGTF